MTKLLDEKRITRIQLPGNSSDLNPLENLWAVIRYREGTLAQEIMFGQNVRERGEILIRPEHLTLIVKSYLLSVKNILIVFTSNTKH